MNANRTQGLLVAVPVLGATLALTVLLGMLGGVRLQAAPLRSGTGSDPAIQSVAVTASLLISDTHPGDGITKTIYFSNTGPGVITLTFEITGTPTLTLTAGTAFNDPLQVLTSSVSPWNPVITYSVETGGENWPSVGYTVTNTNGVQTAIYITYTPDSLPPSGVVTHSGGYYVPSAPVSLTLTASDNLTGCGVAQMCISENPVCEDWETYSTAKDWSLSSGDGEKTLYAWFRDYLGNTGGPYTDTVFLDTAAPVSVVITAPNHISATTFSVSWQAADPDPGSGVVSYTVGYQQNGSSWQSWLGNTTQTSGTFNAPQTEQTYTFRVTAYDGAGNSAWSETTTRVGAFYVYLPLALRNYQLLVNGDFESGFDGWNTGQGPFGGHGSGMPTGVISFEGSHRALLGEPEATNDSINVGYGYIAQTFSVNKPYLQLQYRVVSYDIAKGSERYYDTFEVSVNRPPNQITDAERDSRGCADTRLNPGGALIVSQEGLAFCGGRSGTSGMGTLWDSGWKTVTLDLSTFQGQNITLYLSMWSREYESPYYNDRAWYNTWSYV
ncbi:MAG: fibronectin type III domain-containing protein, partial [Anaerolineae bacterium]|nr:fibronectin type III domain-containing protein [Anaerolineae bacterium]